MTASAVRVALAALAAFAAAGIGIAVADAPPLAGHVIVARTGADALLIWDASSDVSAIVADKSSNEDAERRLQRDGLRIIVSSLGKLDASAKTISVRIVYDKTGAVSPVYGAATLADVERYATLTVPAAAIRAHTVVWRDVEPGKALPAWVSFRVTGQLPPR
ncbi:MAG TPA: hypothetical protein VGN14_03220 [Candidatus Elarobacter sp.]|jgi:hypothetical protein